uniref:Transmembrane and coiled-coil domains protein 1-like n=1 Tax=Sinocyclocheilus grahami TaxID=75366 RepID=A0A672PGE2_SINGR
MDQGGSEQPGAEEPDSGGRAEWEESRRVSEPDHGLSKITHNALENMGVLGHGLKHFFQPQRRRSSVSPHDYASSSTGPIPEPPEAGPELGEVPAVMVASPNSEPHASAPPAALSRVLQQIRGPPMMKRGTSLQSRRSKSGGGGEAPQKGSPQIHRRSTQETLLQAGRPRSSSTTDTPSSPAFSDMLLTSGYHSTEEADRVTDSCWSLRKYINFAQWIAGSAFTVDKAESSPGRHMWLPQARRPLLCQIRRPPLTQPHRLFLTLAAGRRSLKPAVCDAVFCCESETTLFGLPKEDTTRNQWLSCIYNTVTGGLSSISQATHSAAGAVVSKPREFASLIRNRFGSADNISALKDSLDEQQEDEPVTSTGTAGTRTLGPGQLQSSPKYGSEDDCSSATSGSAGANSATGAPGGPPSSKGNTLEHGQSSGFDALLHEIQELKDNQSRLEESFENLKSHYQRDYTEIMQALQEERYRCERLEEQLNDLTELHQNEIINLKQELASMEEKIAYQSYERARDIQEALEACQTRISKMELQQQQQQVVQLEGLENATARTLLGKLINVLLAVMAVLLVFVSTVANCVVPLMKTRSRTLSTLLLVIFLAFLWRNWEAMSQYLDRFLLHPR